MNQHFVFLTSGFSETTWCLKHSLSIMAGGSTESCHSPQPLTFSGGLVTSHRPHSPFSCPQNISISPPGTCLHTGGRSGSVTSLALLYATVQGGQRDGQQFSGRLCADAASDGVAAILAGPDLWGLTLWTWEICGFPAGAARHRH